ncbi:MAG: hypothetical protein H6727_03970 [Myxococcales bacterium]|nr:hypothetical protein [Myxococcales bacterium]
MFELLFKTHFWSFKLFFVLGSSYLLAVTTSQVVRASLPATVPYTIVDETVRGELIQKKNAQFAILNQINLFDPNQKSLAPPPRPVETPKSKKKQENDPATATCPTSGYRESKSLPLELKGTVATATPGLGVAVLFDATDRQTVVVRAGDVYKGLRICKIEPRFLKVDRGMGRLEYLELGKKPGRLGSVASNYYNKYQKLRKKSFDTSKIRKMENGRYQIPRDFISQVTGKLDVLASKAAIVPFFEKGQPVGFRIYSIRQGSLYEKIGIKNNDVIRQINGYKFTSPQKALEAYSNLMSASSLNVSVQRGGRMVDMRYEIKE